MKLIPNKWALCIGVVLLLAGGPLAESAQEEFQSPPTAGNLRARDAVAAPHIGAGDLQPGQTQGMMARTQSERPSASLPDFRVFGDVSTKKSRFFDYLLPLVQAENVRLTAIRKRLSYIYDHVRWHRQIDEADQQWLALVSQEFRLPTTDSSRTEFWVSIFQRVDAVPEELALAQAANESAWGTSRFAREGNNLFGQWCFRQGCGMVPAGRPAGATYEVARYDSVSESIGSYMHNLNTGRTYQLLREIRSRMRIEGQAPAATELAAGLRDYSERGIDYVNELRAMIRHNSGVIDEVRQRGESEGSG
ncbi:MAG: glucosaminidase domain-containing protein [Candidatus Krumholzibacteria bacterium]|nr:glucosaminidase domain-containing protein [Candidatus Krumholzibacteria bacterium]